MEETNLFASGTRALQKQQQQTHHSNNDDDSHDAMPQQQLSSANYAEESAAAKQNPLFSIPTLQRIACFAVRSVRCFTRFAAVNTTFDDAIHNFSRQLLLPQAVAAQVVYNERAEMWVAGGGGGIDGVRTSPVIKSTDYRDLLHHASSSGKSMPSVHAAYFRALVIACEEEVDWLVHTLLLLALPDSFDSLFHTPISCTGPTKGKTRFSGCDFPLIPHLIFVGAAHSLEIIWDVVADMERNQNNSSSKKTSSPKECTLQNLRNCFFETLAEVPILLHRDYHRDAGADALEKMKRELKIRRRDNTDSEFDPETAVDRQVAAALRREIEEITTNRQQQQQQRKDDDDHESNAVQLKYTADDARRFNWTPPRFPDLRHTWKKNCCHKVRAALVACHTNRADVLEFILTRFSPEWKLPKAEDDVPSDIGVQFKPFWTLCVVDENENTALHICCSHDSLRCAQLLIEYGADVNATNMASATPLHIAAANGNDALVRLLLSCEGIKKDAVDGTGRSVKAAARMGGCSADVVALLPAVSSGSPLAKK